MVDVNRVLMHFIHVFESKNGGMNWGLAWSGTENLGSKETYRENLTQSVILEHLELTFAIVVCIGFMWSPAIYKELLDRSRSPRVQYKHLPSALEHWSLAQRSLALLVGFLRISWSSCAMRLCEVLQWSSNAWAFERPVRQTFVKVQLLTPKSEGPKSFSWLTEVQSKCQPDTFAKKQWQDSSREPLMSWWSTCVQKRLVKPRSQGSMDRKKKGKNLRKQGGMSQGKADDSLIFADSPKKGFEVAVMKRPYAVFDDVTVFCFQCLFFDVFCRLGLFLAELHPEHHVAGRIRENPRKCLRESVMSRWIPVRARRAIPPLTTAIITWPVKRAEVRHRTHRRWVWNGVNMAYFFLKPFLVCPKVLTAIRQESHHFLDKWAYLNLFGIVWHFGHCHDLLFRAFSISERLKRYFFWLSQDL